MQALGFEQKVIDGKDCWHMDLDPLYDDDRWVVWIKIVEYMGVNEHSTGESLCTRSMYMRVEHVHIEMCGDIYLAFIVAFLRFLRILCRITLLKQINKILETAVKSLETTAGTTPAPAPAPTPAPAPAPTPFGAAPFGAPAFGAPPAAATTPGMFGGMGPDMMAAMQDPARLQQVKVGESGTGERNEV